MGRSLFKLFHGNITFVLNKTVSLLSNSVVLLYLHKRTLNKRRNPEDSGDLFFCSLQQAVTFVVTELALRIHNRCTALEK